MPFIGKAPETGAFRLIDSITTSATDTYALTVQGDYYFPASARNLIVSLNGVTQAPETAYTVSGSHIVFASALTANDVIDYILVIGDAVDIGTPSDGTVGNAQLKASLDFSGKTLTFSNDQISGDAIDGGTATLDGLTVDTDTLVVDSTDDRVGVNCTPNYSFEVSSAVQIYDDGSSHGVITAGSGYDLHLGARSGGVVKLFSSGLTTPDVTITSGGNVGIGNSSPASMAGGTSTNPVLSVGGSDSSLNTSGDSVGSISFITADGSYTGTFADGVAGEVACVTDTGTGGGTALTFYTGNTGVGRGERMRITSGGNVGVGTADPTRRFHARGSEQVVGHFESTSTTRAKLTVSDANTTSDSYVGLGAKGDDLELISGNGIKITVTDDGDVGIGTQGPATVQAGNVLQFENTTGTEFIAFRQDAGLVSGDYIGGYIFGSNDSSGTPNHYTGMWATADSVYGSMTLNFGTGRESYETNTPQIVMSGGGNLGVNYTLPDVPLCVGVDAGNTLAARFGTLGSAKAGDDVFVRLQGQNSSNSNKYFDIRHLVDDGALTINGPTSTLTEILRIDADGIKFGGETNAAHALDDYEEGNWLPTPKDSSDNAATFTTRVGYYVKIGRLVYVTVDLVNITTTGCTSTDAVLIKGLPFVPITGSGNTYHTGIASVGGGVASSENVIGVRITEGVDYIVMAKGSQSLMGDLVKFQDMSSGSPDIRFSMSYYTNA